MCGVRSAENGRKVKKMPPGECRRRGQMPPGESRRRHLMPPGECPPRHQMPPGQTPRQSTGGPGQCRARCRRHRCRPHSPKPSAQAITIARCRPHSPKTSSVRHHRRRQSPRQLTPTHPTCRGITNATPQGRRRVPLQEEVEVRALVRVEHVARDARVGRDEPRLRADVQVVVDLPVDVAHLARGVEEAL